MHLSRCKVVDSQEKIDTIFNAISQHAQSRWGEDWQVELIRAYCRIEANEKGEIVTPKNRRTMLVRALETHSCAAETLIRLAGAAGLKLQMTQSL